MHKNSLMSQFINNKYNSISNSNYTRRYENNYFRG